ncbi:MAG: FtsQ-type POTRA domain-containing protein [Lentisphaerae bacterium]|nr:FtsQ-type POTRA domain-containing protein [Lentisphaerota bacterium]
MAGFGNRRAGGYVRSRGEGVSTLNVRLRAERRGARSRKLATAATVVTVMAIVAGLVGAGVTWSLRSLFSRNSRFEIVRLDVGGGSGELAAFLSRGKGIGPGANILGFSISRLRRDLMKDGPQFKDVSIQRKLPDTVVVHVVERVPIVRVIAPRRRLVADSDGKLFGMRPGSSTLPAITGCDENELVAGGELTALSSAALMVVDACQNPRYGLRIEAVDVSHGEYLRAQLADGRTVKLWWQGMGRNDADSKTAMETQLMKVARMLRTSQANGHGVFDATYGDMIVGQ